MTAPWIDGFARKDYFIWAGSVGRKVTDLPSV